MKEKIAQLINKHPKTNQIIPHVRVNDVCRVQTEVLKLDFIELFNCLEKLEAQFFYWWTAAKSQQRDQQVQQTLRTHQMAQQNLRS